VYTRTHTRTHTHTHAGNAPRSPYVKMDASWGALQERAANAARAAECLDPEEVNLTYLGVYIFGKQVFEMHVLLRT